VLEASQGGSEGFQLLAVAIGVTAREFVVGADARTCRSNFDLDEDGDLFVFGQGRCREYIRIDIGGRWRSVLNL
jgi:hypothetical protein